MDAIKRTRLGTLTWHARYWEVHSLKDVRGNDCIPLLRQIAGQPAVQLWRHIEAVHQEDQWELPVQHCIVLGRESDGEGGVQELRERHPRQGELKRQHHFQGLRGGLAIWLHGGGFVLQHSCALFGTVSQEVFWLSNHSVERPNQGS
jgi:hypothetical protein